MRLFWRTSRRSVQTTEAEIGVEAERVKTVAALPEELAKLGFFTKAVNSVLPAVEMALPVVVDAEYLKEVDKARRDLRALITIRNYAPLMLRLAEQDLKLMDMHEATWSSQTDDLELESLEFELRLMAHKILRLYGEVAPNWNGI
ncbi:hypothetical protein AHAS_Ahas02G0152800 [Arachis hypogaea]